MLRVSLTTKPYLPNNADGVQKFGLIIFAELPVLVLPTRRGFVDMGEKLRDGGEGFFSTLRFKMLPETKQARLRLRYRLFAHRLLS